MKIIFNDHSSINYISCVSTSRNWGNANRQVLEFMIPCSENIVTVNSLCTEDNLSTITLVNEDITNFYDGYVLKIECGIESDNTDTSGISPSAEHIKLILGKRTPMEELVHNIIN